MNNMNTQAITIHTITSPILYNLIMALLGTQVLRFTIVGTLVLALQQVIKSRDCQPIINQFQ